MEGLQLVRSKIETLRDGIGMNVESIGKEREKKLSAKIFVVDVFELMVFDCYSYLHRFIAYYMLGSILPVRNTENCTATTLPRSLKTYCQSLVAKRRGVTNIMLCVRLQGKSTTTNNHFALSRQTQQ